MSPFRLGERVIVTSSTGSYENFIVVEKLPEDESSFFRFGTASDDYGRMIDAKLEKPFTEKTIDSTTDRKYHVKIRYPPPWDTEFSSDIYALVQVYRPGFVMVSLNTGILVDDPFSVGLRRCIYCKILFYYQETGIRVVCEDCLAEGYF